MSALAGGYVADAVFGDPRRFHPVAGFGALAGRAERLTYAPSRARGAAFALTLVAAAGIAAEVAARRTRRTPVLALVTWAALGGRSLTNVARRLGEQLDAGDIDAARETLPWLCGRDPRHLDEAALVRATVESVAENTSDAVIGALFWGRVAGPAGVVAYRAVNTLDAMVGHKSDRYREFGWAAAKLDDVANWIPSRLTAALTIACAPVVGGSPVAAARIWWRDRAKHPSPNAGQVEAAFAGALGVRLGGPLTYDGVAEVRPHMGDGAPPTRADIRRATRLSRVIGLVVLL